MGQATGAASILWVAIYKLTLLVKEKSDDTLCVVCRPLNLTGLQGYNLSNLEPWPITIQVAVTMGTLLLAALPGLLPGLL